MNRINTFLLIFLAAFGIIYSIAAIKSTVNWDEEASYDIAHGLRPAYAIDIQGLFKPTVPYTELSKDSIFTSADYAKFNTLPNLMQSVLNDNSNSVVYYIALHSVIAVTGPGIFYLKMFSVFIALLNLLLIYRLGNRLFIVPLMPFCLVVLVACNPLFFQSAILVRSYSLALFFSLAAVEITFAGILNNQISARRMFLVSLLAAMAFLTNYFSSALLFGLVVCLLYAMQKNKQLLRNRVSSITSTALIFLVIVGQWLLLAHPEGLDNLQTINRGWAAATSGNGYSLSLANYAKQLSNSFAYLLGFNYNLLPLPRALSQVVAGLCGAGVLFLFVKNRCFHPNPRLIYVYLMLAAAFAVFSLAAVLSGHFMIFEAHYQIFLLPVYSIALLGIFDFGLLNAKTRMFAGVLLGIIVGINCFMVYANLSALGDEPMKEIVSARPAIRNSLNGFEQAAAYISQKATDGARVTYPGWKEAQQTNYFLAHRTDLRQAVRTTSKIPYIELINNTGDTILIHITE